MWTRGAPERIRRGHSPDQGPDLGVDARAAADRRPGEPGPVLVEASALPSQDGVGRHDDESPSPSGPDFGQPDPQQTIPSAELRPGHHSLVSGQLLAQGEILERDVAVAADEERKEPEQVKQERDHEPRLLPDLR